MLVDACVSPSRSRSSAVRQAISCSRGKKVRWGAASMGAVRSPARCDSCKRETTGKITLGMWMGTNQEAREGFGPATEQPERGRKPARDEDLKSHPQGERRSEQWPIS